VKQIIINLLNNAYKFTDKGSIMIDVSICSEEEAKALQIPSLREVKRGFRNWLKNDMQRSKSTTGAPSRKSGSHAKKDRASTPPPAQPVQPVPPLQASRVHGKYSRSSTVAENKIGKWKYIKFAIHDTGVGIQEKDFDRLFRTFSQLDSTSTKKYSGTGLGLSIVDKFSKLMNGKASFTSKYGEGSSFYFVIPMCEYADQEDKMDLSILKGKNVLVVDDNPTNVVRLCAYLDKWGMNYRECDSGQRAVMQYVGKERWKFDVGLIDIIMPGMDGNEVAERIQQSSQPFPVIAVSSAYNNRNNGISSVFSFTLLKPYGEVQLAKTLISILSASDLNHSGSSGESTSTTAPYENVYEHPVSHRTSRSSPARSSPPMSLKRSTGNLEKSPPKRNIFSRIFTNDVSHESVHPVPPASPTSPVPPVPPYEGMLGSYDEEKDSSDVNILIAEDHVFNQKVIVSMLSSMGYNNIDMAENGRDVVNLVKQNRGVVIRKDHKGKFVEKSQYDIIFMDIAMPIMDGLEAAKNIDELFKRRSDRPKIVAVTANAMSGDKEKYLNEGKMDAYISKPITSKDVLYDVLF
jgi:CheY-like chemotaxis protein